MNELKAEIIAIGDELLLGQTLDSNSHWISEKLTEIGIFPCRRTTVGDLREDILDAFSQAKSRSNLVLITGGLGPTNDDLTKPLLAEFFDSDILLNESALEDVENYFHSRGREVSEVNRKQAELPDKCQKVTNAYGTAPGMWFEENNTVFVSMPGVPREMKGIMTDQVLPKVKEVFDLPAIGIKMVKTVAIGESVLAEMLSEFEEQLPNHVKLAYLPEAGEVKLRLTGRGKDKVLIDKELSLLEESLIKIVGSYVYGKGNETLASSVGKALKNASSTIATAESCTGGYLAHQITSVAGSSSYFMGSIISYNNEIKKNVLRVDNDTLLKHGAVSEQVVIQMAENARKMMNTTFALSTSGIAGPDGGTEEKPVGTVWIACASELKTVTKCLHLGSKDRTLNIHLSAIYALDMLRKEILEN
ncbi:competence/damage-inducible protein A [Aureibacter tunicatorum]|uniref:CinA-like protein n=1 Tax=Aureibacter tunicatorum TaxID=866807 RepID=A0AAE3XRX6_9BACT|nr:competence/damage-inducible protein A [Aureibacter tunicatorum]MDR6240914.1 nicotinamide-nucleotide amidase [Aureibacter tunicatorum]BDD03694.1 CinA-like protein [Aureibacter tunicatorum]